MQTDPSRRHVLAALGAVGLGAAAGLSAQAPALAGPVATRPFDAAGGVRTGVDYSWHRPSPQGIVQAGHSFVNRYLSWDDSGKNLTRAEADALQDAGLEIVCNWEYYARDALDGYPAGVQNAVEARRQAREVGMPDGRPIYFSVDFDSTEDDQIAINAYFDGVISVMGLDAVGAYGGYYPVKRLFDGGRITWGWQTFSWSGGQWDPRLHLRQVRNGVWIDGAAADVNRAMRTDFGQWSNRH